MGTTSSKQKKKHNKSFKKLKTLIDDYSIRENDLKELIEKLYQEYPSGFLTKNDIENRIGKLFTSNKVLNKVLQYIDKNNDNKISIAEYIEVIVSLKYGSPQKRMEFIFNIFDENDDKKLSRQEVANVAVLILNMSTPSKPTKQEVLDLTNKIFKRIDIDKSEEIDFEEFFSIARKEFQLSESIIQLAKDFDSVLQ